MKFSKMSPQQLFDALAKKLAKKTDLGGFQTGAFKASYNGADVYYAYPEGNSKILLCATSPKHLCDSAENEYIRIIPEDKEYSSVLIQLIKSDEYRFGLNGELESIY